ncbi:GT251 galactosyltransferase, partial [Psilopogon haemacephalus]|nr:GT251 galactosyltransferase [Psilopogon haemacephalus]
FLDADNVLTNPESLQLLMAQNRTLVAPMLDSRAAYSNFWAGITPQGYYRRTAAYLPVRRRQRQGCFAVPMVHSTFLLDLRKEASALLAFYPPHPHYPWALDDIITFAFSCQQAGVPMVVCNQQPFGFLPVPLSSHSSLQDEVENFQHLLLEIMAPMPIPIPIPIPCAPSHPHSHPGADSHSHSHYSQVFLINLPRRSARRARMLRTLLEQEISCKVVEAVDGSALNSSQVQALGIRMLPGYRDPYHGRSLTGGELGCFLSHYRVWQEVVSRGLRRSLVFEDDLRFEIFFKRRLRALMDELEASGTAWDLIYLGRKRLQLEVPELPVPRVRNLVVPNYSYWTLAYALSLRGATKLLAAQPLAKVLPVDEFLPLMFNKHP